ncbi:MAG: hypothetical protein P4L56_30550 [Candidatus Sulfopaludibacter sp.]|nr:hypothetical protein [Candidatus Sulfopaludibacter sp.]
MKAGQIILDLTFLTAGLPGLLHALDLRVNTLHVWNDYTEGADSGMQARLDGREPFLWTDEVPGRASGLQHGKILIGPLAGHGIRPVPNGLIHDWIGAVFIPHASIRSLLAVLHDYDRYKDVYKPAVAESKALACTEADQRFSMVWQHKVLFVSAAIEGQYSAREFIAGQTRGYNIGDTTEVREIQAYGESGEHLLAPGHGSGFIWRMHSIARYEERDGGVYLELEAIALTRDIPLSLRWLVSPVVNHLSIDSLTTSLRQTREAVESLEEEPGRFVSCAAPEEHSLHAGRAR